MRELIQRRIEQLLIPYSMDIYILKHRLKMWRQRWHRRLGMTSFRVRYNKYEVTSRFTHRRAARILLNANRITPGEVVFEPVEQDLRALGKIALGVVLISTAAICFVAGLNAICDVPYEKGFIELNPRHHHAKIHPAYRTAPRCPPPVRMREDVDTQVRTDD